MVANTTKRTTLVGSGAGSLLFEAEEFVLGSTWHVQLSGLIDNNGTGNKVTLKLMLGASQLITTEQINLDIMSATQPFQMGVDIVYRGGTSFSSNSCFTYVRGTNQNHFRGWNASQNVDIDVSDSVLLNATAEWNNANQNNTLTCKILYVKKVY